MPDDTKVIISMEKYKHLKECQKNLESIGDMFDSKETKELRDDCYKTKDEFWHQFIIPIYEKSHIFREVIYKYINTRED